ncbi:hypothetical protein DRP05_02915 [Archaeoglobales archaeon]|nr:MAG: hypothetical protein DRP05_02915 [Archaeoglobales archaeon]
MNSKAVSEVLSYVFVFSIIVVTVSIVYTQVNNIIEDTKAKYQLEGLRQSFKRIQNVIYLVTYGKAPQQALDVELQGGSMWIENSSFLTIRFDGIKKYEDYVNSLNYEFENERISYENGGVWEEYYGNQNIISNPRIFLVYKEVENKTLLIVIVTKIVGNLSISGSGTIKLKIMQSNKTFFSSEEDGSPHEVEINISSYYNDAWFDFFDSKLRSQHRNPAGIDVSSDSSKVIARITCDKFILTTFNVRIEGVSNVI